MFWHKQKKPESINFGSKCTYMVTEIPRELWISVIEKAIRLAKLEPWNWMTDGNLFAVRDPFSQEICYISVMGYQGEFHGIAVYPGNAGLDSLEKLTVQEPNEQMMYQQAAIVLGFHFMDDLEPETSQLIRSLGLIFPSNQRIPEIITHKPGFVPWAPSVDELKTLEVILPQITQVCNEFRADPLLFGEGQDLTEFYLSEKKDGFWESKFFTPVRPHIFRPVTPDWNKNDLTKALNGLEKEQSYVLIEQFYLPFPVEEGVRPFFPNYLVLLDLQSQQILTAAILKPEEIITDLPKLITTMFQQIGFIPADLIVSNKENYKNFRDLARNAGIDIHLDESLDIVDNIIESFKESMG